MDVEQASDTQLLSQCVFEFHFICNPFVSIFTALFSAPDALLQARPRIASRTVTVLFSIRQSSLLPRGTTPRVNPAFYLHTPGGHHHRFPQTPLCFHSLSSPRRQILPRCIPALCNHLHSSHRARGRLPSLQIHKSRVHSHCG